MFIRYEKQARNVRREESAYRMYIADVLKSALGVNESLRDIMKPRSRVYIDVDATINSVAEGSGLEVIG